MHKINIYEGSQLTQPTTAATFPVTVAGSCIVAMCPGTSGTLLDLY